MRKNWDKLPLRELLQVRLKDLNLKIKGSLIQDCIVQLHEELAAKGLRFRPHYWISDEWFSPDGIPGVAIPFYLLHPRLRRLERRMLLELEGGEHAECMKILRHETGHALETAYRLCDRRSWKKMFGDDNRPYPETYKPRPMSRNYVLHLDLWYAQSHPVEDFAETFAVWLRPQSNWRKQYQKWGALKKLEYVDGLMQKLKRRRPPVSNKRRFEELRTLNKTLGEHYDRKRSYYNVESESFYERELVRLFSKDPKDRNKLPASKFLRRNRKVLRDTIATWLQLPTYSVDQVLQEMIQRSTELNLRTNKPQTKLLADTLVMVTIQLLNHLHLGHHRVSL